MSGWRVLPLHDAPAFEQLRRTESLWQAVAAGQAPPTLRWYTYPSPALVLGIGQAETILDTAAVREDGVEIVKRASGGAVVFAGPELIALDVALPSTSPLALHDVVESYRWLGEAFVDALTSLAPGPRVSIVSPSGARADQEAQRTAPPTSPQHARTLACFGVLSPYEVALDRQRKLVGFSQLRKRGVVLYQVGFYKRFAGERLARYLYPGPGMAEELDARIAHLAELNLSAWAVIEAASAAIEARAPTA